MSINDPEKYVVEVTTETSIHTQEFFHCEESTIITSVLHQRFLYEAGIRKIVIVSPKPKRKYMSIGEIVRASKNGE